MKPVKNDKNCSYFARSYFAYEKIVHVSNASWPHVRHLCSKRREKFSPCFLWWRCLNQMTVYN